MREIPSGKAMVLVVEAQPELRALLRRALERDGYGVMSAENASEATQLSAAHRGEIELLIADADVRFLDDPALAGKIIRRPNIHVLYLSSCLGASNCDDAVLLDGTPHLAKPFTLQQLRIAVRRAIETDTASKGSSQD